MKTLQVVQKSFRSLGLSSQIDLFNLILITSFPFEISLWIYLFYEANTSQEFMESIYMTTICTAVFASYASTLLITDKLFSFFDSFDDHINESK